MIKSKLIALAALIGGIFTAHAQLSTNTINITGATWDDASTLNGYFTVIYNNGTPQSVLTLDIVTGDGLFPGYHYLYNVENTDDTIAAPYFDALQGIDWPANEVVSHTFDVTRGLNIDWTGNNPGALYLGAPQGLHSSEIYYVDGFQIRDLTTEGGSVSTPEPTSTALAAIGGLSMLILRRRNK